MLVFLFYYYGRFEGIQKLINDFKLYIIGLRFLGSLVYYLHFYRGPYCLALKQNCNPR